MRRKLLFIRALATGIALEYLFDPQLGRTRRAKLRDQLMAKARKVSRLVGKKMRYQQGRIKGTVHDMANAREQAVGV
jgi:hypothetical protein